MCLPPLQESAVYLSSISCAWFYLHPSLIIFKTSSFPIFLMHYVSDKVAINERAVFMGPHFFAQLASVFWFLVQLFSWSYETLTIFLCLCMKDCSLGLMRLDLQNDLRHKSCFCTFMCCVLWFLWIWLDSNELERTIKYMLRMLVWSLGLKYGAHELKPVHMPYVKTDESQQSSS